MAGLSLVGVNMVKEALCFGGPLDGKVKPVQGTTLIASLAHHEPGFLVWFSRVKYYLRIRLDVENGQRDFFWLADES